MGPAPVEHKFSARIVLDVEWHRADQLRSAVANQQVMRLPGRIRSYAPRMLERGEELVAQERRIARQAVPCRGVDILDFGYLTQLHCVARSSMPLPPITP